ncbi:hypothetical protein EJ05DRAFT_201834 [Pseudovirgaria hyperparasitica]|uniref:Uncharacterized protein n=1 Tax=Pseudovirgaria hyperparasitica TaxID=470096 RepID=A0A6A6WHF0_9PEZI|nr:uncharacterized protein EJ05DRAFT_201834 [Pseudovirgaria hyperparasitica]KAF2762233.1 hypothetical protein EJ05DRAFT_201834 [Pseudovirgaria hyperparasitica]
MDIPILTTTHFPRTLCPNTQCPFPLPHSPHFPGQVPEIYTPPAQHAPPSHKEPQTHTSPQITPQTNHQAQDQEQDQAHSHSDTPPDISSPPPSPSATLFLVYLCCSCEMPNANHNITPTPTTPPPSTTQTRHRLRIRTRCTYCEHPFARCRACCASPVLCTRDEFEALLRADERLRDEVRRRLSGLGRSK